MREVQAKLTVIGVSVVCPNDTKLNTKQFGLLLLLRTQKQHGHFYASYAFLKFPAAPLGVESIQ